MKLPKSIIGLIPLWLFLILFANGINAQQSVAADTIILTGKINRFDLVQECQWFNERINRTFLDDSTLQLLKTLTKDIHFVMIIGTWCSDSREHVPAFFKIMDSIGITEDKVSIYAVNRKKSRVLTPELKSLKFEFVPTFIVYRKNKEIGRIVEDTKVSMEKDLLTILSGRRY